MTLGDLIKQYRHKHGISMEQFSKMSGLSKQYIGILEKNMNPTTKRPVIPTIKTYQAVANAMSMDLNDLIDAVDSDKVDFTQSSPAASCKFDSEQQTLLHKFNMLNDDGKEKLIGYADDLTKIKQYLK